MNDLPDYELQKTPGESSPPTRSSMPPSGVWASVALLIAAAGAAAYIAFRWRPPPALTPTSAPTAAARAEPSLGGTAEAVSIPPLDASDAVVRTLVRALSESPAVAAWLSTDGLIRNLAVVAANIADGTTPAKHLKPLRPSSPFDIVERHGIANIDSRSYDRYAVIADAVASVDPAGAARIYAIIKPRVEEAHRELGFPDQSFDRTLQRAIVSLLRTPVLDGPVALKPKGIGYAFADERLEGLTAAQKQLLRMGPRNVRIIKERLRRIALALGVPSDELPSE
jgi:hypothetical protein